MEPRPISIGKNPLIGLTKLVRGETVSAVNVHDCVDTMVRAVQAALREEDSSRDHASGEMILSDLLSVRTLLTGILSERMAAIWKGDQESRVPANGYDHITLDDVLPFDLSDLASKTVQWLES